MPGPRVAQAVREIARGPRPDELVAKARAAGLLPHYIRGEKRRQEEMALLGELFVEGEASGCLSCILKSTSLLPPCSERL